jgi:hypothetical protein
MGYTYEFDQTCAGTFRLSRSKYRTLHEGLRLLRKELESWNVRARDHGARANPYGHEVDDLGIMVEWGDARVSNARAREIEVREISVGSLRYMKAAALLVVRTREQELREKVKEHWPDGALRSLDQEIEEMRALADMIEYEPSDVLWEVIPRQAGGRTAVDAETEWDVFVSHASEDTEDIAHPLADKLRANGLKVWFDGFTLTVGDSLRREIDRGLARSRFGVVIISPAFLQKEWPQKEVDGLVAREVGGVKVILPVWHRISADEIRRYSPILADRFAASSAHGLDWVVAELMRAIGRVGPCGS